MPIIGRLVNVLEAHSSLLLFSFHFNRLDIQEKKKHFMTKNEKMHHMITQKENKKVAREVHY
jgi:hypothetical protein